MVSNYEKYTLRNTELQKNRILKPSFPFCYLIIFNHIPIHIHKVKRISFKLSLKAYILSTAMAVVLL